MSNTKPYRVKVGGATYMIQATTRAQATRIALAGYPAPVVDIQAATGGDVMAWINAGRPTFTKDNFVADIPATVVLYVTDDGQLAAEEDMRLEPGNYYLCVERVAAEPLPVADDGPLQELQEAGMQALAEVAEETGISEAISPEGVAEEKFDPETGEVDHVGYVEDLPDTDDEDHDVQAMVDDMIEDQLTQVDEADYPVPAESSIDQPQYHGAFAGDVFYGDPADRARATHVWRKGAWHAYDAVAT